MARAWGVAPSRLHGREPREITTYEYDDEGRIIRAVTVREPEWTEQDYAEAVGLLAVEADTCNGCGEPMSESTHPDAEGGYAADLPTRCHACTTLEQRRDEYTDAPHGRALLFEVHRTWTPPTPPS